MYNANLIICFSNLHTKIRNKFNYNKTLALMIIQKNNYLLNIREFENGEIKREIILFIIYLFLLNL